MPPRITSSPPLPLSGMSLPGPPSMVLSPSQSQWESSRSPRFATPDDGMTQRASPAPPAHRAAGNEIGMPLSRIDRHGAGTGSHSDAYSFTDTSGLLRSPGAAS